MSFGNKTAQKLNSIKKKKLSAIINLLAINREVLPLTIDVGPITLWDLFKTLCMGTVVAEFNDILFNSIRKTFKVIQAYFNKKMCIADEKSNEVKALKK